MKVTRSSLNNLIEWSSSRYNESKKSDVITDIIFRVEKGEDCIVEYRSGCYSERAHMHRTNTKWTGGSYTLEIKEGIAVLKNYVSDVTRSVSGKDDEIILEKPSLNKYFMNAKKIYHMVDKWGIPVGAFDVTGEDCNCYHIIFENDERYVDKKDCYIIERGF